MSELSKLPNIGKNLADRLEQLEITTETQLKSLGTENVMIKIATVENVNSCMNMMYAIEGAIQGIRWHGLDKGRKQELLEFFKQLEK